MKEIALFQKKICKLCEGRDYVRFFPMMVYLVPNNVKHRGILKNICQSEMKSFSLFMLHR